MTGREQTASSDDTDLDDTIPSTHKKQKKKKKSIIPQDEAAQLEALEGMLKKENSACRRPRKLYNRICRKHGLQPETRVIRELGSENINLSGQGLGRRGVKCALIALTAQSCLVTLDLSGNSLGGKEVGYVADLITSRADVRELNLSDNCLSGRGIHMVSELLQNTLTLTRLHLAGTSLKDRDSDTVGSLLTDDNNLTFLNLSRNELREAAGRSLGQALRKNDTLEELDLSWNHLRCKGAEALALGLVKNARLSILNVSWNGFAYEGALAMTNALQHNMTLTNLDLSSNRIHPPGAMELWLNGVLKNKTLRVLKLGWNPITPVAATAMLAKFREAPECDLRFLDLSHVVVTQEFVALLKEVEEKRDFRCDFELATPVHWSKWEEQAAAKRNKAASSDTYNIDPVRVLFHLKKKLRILDLFHRIDKDESSNLSRDEIRDILKRNNLDLSSSAIDALMDYMDTNKDGKIDLLEFFDAERRLKREEIAKRQRIDNLNQVDISATVEDIPQDPGGLQLRYTSTFKTKEQLNPAERSDQIIRESLDPLARELFGHTSDKQPSSVPEKLTLPDLNKKPPVRGERASSSKKTTKYGLDFPSIEEEK